MRAVVVQEMKVDVPYRLAELRPLENAAAPQAQLDLLREEFTILFTSRALGETGVGKQFRKMIASGWSCLDLTDLAAFTFLDNVELKQSLLAERDVLVRVTRTLEALKTLAAELPKVISVSRNLDPSLN